MRGRARFLLAMVRYRKEPAKAIAEAKVARVEIASLLASDDVNAEKDPIGAPYLRRRYERWLQKLDAWLQNPK